MNDLTDILGIDIIDFDDVQDDDIRAKYEDKIATTDDKGRVYINENEYAKYYCEYNKLSYNNGVFYTKDGKFTEDLITQDIWHNIAHLGITSNVAAMCKKLCEVIKISATKESMEANPDVIPFANGDLYYKEKVFKRNDYIDNPYRLPVNLITNIPKAPHFNKWLKDLFHDDDIPTIQQYLGYCLVPKSSAQKALFLVGEGGSGKSVLGIILQTMLGDSMLSIPNTQDFIKDKFKIAELENKLVLFDDDMDNAALDNTGLYKKLITNNIYITADRKYGQPFKFKPFSKVVACCNEMLVASTDSTDGFYRRLLPIVTKPKAKDFKPDKDFYSKIASEINYITLWAIQGLLELVDNNWVLPESERTINYITQKQIEANPVPAFLTDTFIFGTEDALPTNDIYNLYKQWANDNGMKIVTIKALSTYLKDNAEKYDIEYTRTIKIGDKQIRGFKGLSLKTHSTIIKLA